MHFPIFNSIVNKIKTELQIRGIEATNFKQWNDTSINATGLELILDVTEYETGIKEVVINFDWDSFREVKLAKNLSGMDKHPLLQNKMLSSTRVAPTIDVEILWRFDETLNSSSINEAADNTRFNYATTWMNSINTTLNKLIPTNQTITRWHLEIQENENSKYVSSMNLISYIQYSMNNLSNINEVHQFVHHKLTSIFDMSSKVLGIAKKTRPVAAA